MEKSRFKRDFFVFRRKNIDPVRNYDILFRCDPSFQSRIVFLTGLTTGFIFGIIMLNNQTPKVTIKVKDKAKASVGTEHCSVPTLTLTLTSTFLLNNL